MIRWESIEKVGTTNNDSHHRHFIRRLIRSHPQLLALLIGVVLAIILLICVEGGFAFVDAFDPGGVP